MGSNKPITEDGQITIAQWLQRGILELKKVGIDSARLDCLILLETALAKTRSWIIAHSDEELDAAATKKLTTFIAQRATHTPLAYIVGSKEFYGHAFLVDNSVLIPRPESEAMLDLLQKIALENDINTVIDIGTGSGCLIISAALMLPQTHMTAADISGAALVVARRNARRHKVRIRFHTSDLLAALPGMPGTRRYVTLANLPYVPADLVTSPEISKEPQLALFSGDDGLDHYRRFWGQISELKNKPFAVITESLAAQHPALKRLAEKAGYTLQTAQDLAQLFSQQ